MMKKNVLNASILAALGLGMAGTANAVIVGTPVVLDSQVTQADGDLGADAEGTVKIETQFSNLDLGTIDNRNFTVVYSLGQGARFESGSTLALVCTGATGVFSGDVAAFAGGASAGTATFVLDASGATQTSISHCTLTVSGAGGTGGLKLASGSNNSSITVVVSGNGLLVGSPIGFSTTGAIVTSAPGVNATAVAGATGILDVVSGYVNFTSATNSTDASGDMDAYLGYVQYAATTATRTLVSAVATASDVASSGSITVGGTFVAGIANVTGAYLFQAATSNMGAETVTACSAAAAGNVTGAFNTAAGTVTFNVTSTMIGDGSSGSPVSGVLLCAHVPGGTRIDTGTVTVSFSATSKTGYTASTTTSNTSLAEIGKNGVTRTAWNVPAPSSSDQAYIRVYNTSTLTGKVTGTLYGQDGTALCSNVTLISSLAPNAVSILDVNGIATACGVSTWTGRAYLVMDGEMPTMVVTPLVRASGVLTNMSPIATQ